MSTIVRGDGPVPCQRMIVGERAGYEEAMKGIPFVGQAGRELWDRFFRAGLPDRDHWYVTNLVKTFKPDPPTKDEIDEWSDELERELRRVHPSLIVTVGYHAARYLLPQFDGVEGDYFAGLVHPFRTNGAVVVPIVHSSAALKQPARYQTQLTRDVEAVRRVVDGDRDTHRVRPPYTITRVKRVDAFTIGFDTEYTRDEVHAASVGLGLVNRGVGRLFEHQNAALYQALNIAPSVVCHNALSEYHSLYCLGLPAHRFTFDDTLLKAFLLGEPQSLKVLSYRLLGRPMSTYEDLVSPIDAERVRKVLSDALETLATETGRRDGGRVARRHRDQSPRTRTRPGGLDGVRSRRAVTSLRKLLTSDARDSLRVRWSKSKFNSLVPLPSEPTWKDVEQTTRETYAITDAVAAEAVDEKLDPRIKKDGLTQAYHIDRDVLPWLARSTYVGMKVDVDEVRSLGVTFKREIARLRDEISAYSQTHDVNPLSPPQVSELLFSELEVRPTKRTKSGKHFTTADKYLKARRGSHEVVDKVLRARLLNKYCGTYLDKLPDMVGEDGWYHPDWRPTVAATGRLTETIILLIPKHSADAKRIRACFQAGDGHRLVSCDLSQIELRCMAHLSKDERLLHAFETGEDIHAQVAHELLGAPKGKENQDESKHRLPSKTINFGIINGMTEFGLLDQLHENGRLEWDIESVRDLLVGWFRIHKGVERYWQERISQARRTGYVTDLFGARRLLPGVISQSDEVRSSFERMCLCPIQMTADRISKIWNARMWRSLIRPSIERRTSYCEPWVRVHDATILEVDERQARETEAAMLRLIPQCLSVPMTGEGSIGEKWGGLKG